MKLGTCGKIASTKLGTFVRGFHDWAGSHFQASKMKNIPTLCEVPWNVAITIRQQSNFQTAEIQKICSHEAWYMRKICSHEAWNVDFTTRKNRIFRPQKGRKFLQSAWYLETLISRIGTNRIFRMPKCWSLVHAENLHTRSLVPLKLAFHYCA